MAWISRDCTSESSRDVKETANWNANDANIPTDFPVHLQLRPLFFFLLSYQVKKIRESNDILQ
jgi:hypothetical protein